MEPIIAIRTNGGGAGIGLGHLMRCLSLADELKKQGAQVYFVSKDYKAGNDLLKSRGYEVKTIEPNAFEDEDLKQGAPLLKSADLIITDSYEIGTYYLQKLKQLKTPIASLDDLYGNPNLTTIPSDIIINPNPYAKKSDYKNKTSKDTTLLVGNKYTPLREEFSKATQAKRILNRDVESILITMGGEDKEDNTKKIMQTIEALPSNLKIAVILGAANTHKQQLETYSKTLKNKYQIIQNVPRISEYMLNCDIAITAAGSTVWELCAAGTPFIAIQVADNQQGIIDYIKKSKIGLAIGYPTKQGLEELLRQLQILIKDFKLREKLSAKAKRIIDGKGAQRLAKELLDYLKQHESKIVFKEANKEDSQDLFNWRNDEITRKMSRNTDSVSLENHNEWYQKALKDPKRKLLIAEDQDKKIGMVRFDYQEQPASAEININLNPDFRGQGYGQLVLDQACKYAFKNLKLKRIYAEIKIINIPSIKIFEKAGFQYLPKEQEDLLRMELIK